MKWENIIFRFVAKLSCSYSIILLVLHTELKFTHCVFSNFRLSVTVLIIFIWTDLMMSARTWSSPVFASLLRSWSFFSSWSIIDIVRGLHRKLSNYDNFDKNGEEKTITLYGEEQGIKDKGTKLYDNGMTWLRLRTLDSTAAMTTCCCFFCLLRSQICFFRKPIASFFYTHRYSFWIASMVVKYGMINYGDP